MAGTQNAKNTDKGNPNPSHPVPAEGWAAQPDYNKDHPESVLNRFNLNTMSAQHLSLFPQMTGTRAQSIIDYRDVHGPFHKTSHVKRIAGISDTLAQTVVDRCYAGDPSEPSDREAYENARMGDE